MTALLLVPEVAESRSALQPENTPSQPVLMAWELGHSRIHGPGWFLQNTKVEETWAESNRWAQILPVPLNSCVKPGLFFIYKIKMIPPIQKGFLSGSDELSYMKWLGWCKTWSFSFPPPFYASLSLSMQPFGSWHTASAECQLLLWRNRKDMRYNGG